MSALVEHLKQAKLLVQQNLSDRAEGKVTRISGLVLEATGLTAPVGSVCKVAQADLTEIDAEVVGFKGNLLVLMPLEQMGGILPGAKVIIEEPPRSSPVFGKIDVDKAINYDGLRFLPSGDGLLGRVVDASGKPLDGKGPIYGADYRSIKPKPINPLMREPVIDTLDVGVRAINSILTVGKGQRLGLFAGSGVGKSVLIGMMCKYTQASRVVVGLVGERGREVREFIEHNLAEEGLAKSVVVAAPADCSPLLRMQGANYATSIAERFRDEGHDVLLIMDSLTRYAMAQRELALAMGEPPATKGYPPSVFAKLPALVERAGNGDCGKGTLTAFYTVLTEGDDQQDPIADSARAILDGHIVLSRELADSGHYPAIDIEKSISRVMQNICTEDQIKSARDVKAMFSKVSQNRDLIKIGAYSKGSDPGLDRAIDYFDRIEAHLKQGINEKSDFQASLMSLKGITGDDAGGGQRTLRRKK